VDDDAAAVMVPRSLGLEVKTWTDLKIIGQNLVNLAESDQLVDESHRARLAILGTKAAEFCVRRELTTSNLQTSVKFSGVQRMKDSNDGVNGHPRLYLQLFTLDPSVTKRNIIILMMEDEFNG